jgi:hypothetical protein
VARRLSVQSCSSALPDSPPLKAHNDGHEVGVEGRLLSVAVAARWPGNVL